MINFDNVSKYGLNDVSIHIPKGEIVGLIGSSGAGKTTMIKLACGLLAPDVGKVYKEFCKNNELPFYGIHSFRHFAASSLISAGLDVTTVSGALGHCNSGTTLNVYCHQFQTAQARVSEAMDEAFGFLNKRKDHTA